MIKTPITRGMVIRMLADGALVAAALGLAMGVRLLYLIAFEAPGGDVGAFVRRDAGHFVRACPLMVVICLAVFWASGFYTYSKHYISKYKALIVLQAVSLSYLLFGFVGYFVTGGDLPIARGALLLAWAFTAALLLGARVWSAIWKHHVSPEKESMLRAKDRERRVLVIGGAGYIGSALVPQLLEGGWQVRILDMLMFGEEPLRGFRHHPRLELIQGDFRNVETVLQALREVEHVVHLGAIVGDPACSLDEDLTIDVNLVSTRMIAEIAKLAGVRRFVFASTCSVYGACDELLDERSEVRPVSLYGNTKRASEAVLAKLSSDPFAVTILRFATIYGLSGRTRFDLVVNLLTAKARLDGRITVHGGEQWRPFVHVQDAARSVRLVLEAPIGSVAHEIFNVGSNEQNHTIREIADMVVERVVEAEMEVAADATDHRNYRVSFDKIHRHLGFQPEWTVPDGIQQVLEAIAAGEVGDYAHARYSNVKFLTEEGTAKLAKDGWAKTLLENLTRQ